MLKKILTLFLIVSLSPYAQADYESADAAYKAGDYETAVKEFLPLAEQGLAPAQFNLGWMYQQGLGVLQDYAEAVEWYRKAAEQGFAPAQYSLGIKYEKGLSVQQDYAEVAKWFRKAAEQGHANAQNSLGIMYEKGVGVQRNYAEAVKWFREAAEQGHANAQTNLSDLETLIRLAEAGDAEQGMKSALEKKFISLAEAGNVKAQNNLGTMYQQGLGVQQDYAEAVKWYRKAVEQGFESAKNGLAWLLATCPDETIRDGLEAVHLTEAFANAQVVNVDRLDTLAAAYAEVGRFDDAVETQKKGLSMLKKDQPKFARFQTRLESYQNHKPWREN